MSFEINRYGQKIQDKSIWFVESHANKWFPEESWIFELNLSENGFHPTLRFVNWKRKGGGTSVTFGVDDLNLEKEVGCGGPRPATEKEIEYFKKRTS